MTITEIIRAFMKMSPADRLELLQDILIERTISTADARELGL